MYLSKLELVGFKSFPKKTVLRFNEGITAIVGPNGCGKSNIIDAIRWSIGEQRASVLRSDKMENVIFNGSGQRKPLGMAEVALTIENTRGVLPTEYREVTIARRLFRNGDSEYILNKAQCRLKDIVELFMDTGMGANAYSVIELKMIETILSDRSGDRRMLFEEAAGVTRYKARRKEALRKLEQTRGDLDRVNDIVKEVGKKVASLERQAKKAEEYKELDEERRALDIEVLEREYAATVDRIGPLEANLGEARNKRLELDEQLAQEELTLRELEKEQEEIEIGLAEANKDLSAISGRIATVERERAVAIERRRSLEGTIERAEREAREAETTIAALEQSRIDTEASLVEIREQLAAVRMDYEELEGRVDERQEELNGRRQAVRGSQEEIVGILNRITELRGEEERTKMQIESIRRRLERFDTEDAEAREERARAREIVDEMAIRLEEANTKLTDARASFENAQKAKSDLAAEVEDLRLRSSDVRGELNSRRSKVEFLSGLVGQDESVRYLVEENTWSPAEKRTVEESISTDERYRTAVAAALGSAANYLVVPTFEDAQRGMRTLESGRKGKATFVCLDRVPSVEERAPIDDPRVIGYAADITRSTSDFDALRRFLLNDIVVVETIEQALDVTNEGVALHAVTLDGTLVRAGGVIRGGGTSSDEGALLGRREMIEGLHVEIAQYERELEELGTRIADAQKRSEEINLTALADGIRVAQQELGEFEKRRAQAEYEVEYADDLLNEHHEERQEAEGELAGLQSTLDGIAPRREYLQKEQREMEEKAATLGRELDEFETAYNELLSALNAKRVAMAELQGEERNGRSDLERIVRDRASAERTIAVRGEEVERARDEREELEKGMTERERTLEEFRVELEEARKKQEEISALQLAKREEITKHAEALRTERKGYEDSVELAHSLEMKIGELRSKAESLIERGREELEIELTRKEFDESTLQPMGELRERLRQLKGRIKMLGNVNLLAYDEWQQESERHTFLQTQVDDLRRAEKDLVNTIAEINEIAQRQFLETFEQIRSNFKGLFQHLFHEGDEADLILEEGDDPLEAKIEIIAKPRGKRPHSIDLLSGGEKTLTAISLLFAIYLVKPSPFCILDEVDAPLDDANIERFVKLIRRFDKETQFIIVTHNKKTMAAADTVYGVTQHEDGVSEIVSYRFEKVVEPEPNGARAAARAEAPPAEEEIEALDEAMAEEATVDGDLDESDLAAGMV